jgi:hypothetical protein
MSAPGSTISGAFPPSSIEALTTLSAQACSRSRPTSVDPVNESFRTSGRSIIFATSGPVGTGVTRFTTPFGTPTRRSTSTTYAAVNGVSLAGLRIVVHPAASAGASFLVAMAAGKFHGVISSETPIGCRSTMMRLSPAGERRYSPGIRTASSANQRKNSLA